MSIAAIIDAYQNQWQYHPQSDRHSKIGCWGVLLDLLRNCPTLRAHAAQGKVAFGINHTMVDFVTRRQKNLDLVICIPRAGAAPGRPATFGSLAEDFGVVLTNEERVHVDALPPLVKRPVGDVLVALEAKACMTAFAKARPRLFDELQSSAQCINGSSQNAVAIGLALVNASPDFVSPKQNHRSLAGAAPVVNRDSQPRQAFLTYEKIRQLRVRAHAGESGFDALGICTIIARNDGGPIIEAPTPPALDNGDPLNYERMVLRTAGIYSHRFVGL